MTDSTKNEDKPEISAPTVLVVEDDRGLANLYSLWLSEHYEVETAYDGSEALDMIDESIDVVLLDRRMPDISGDDVLRAVREQELDCRISMVTAVPPEDEIADLPIDEYLTKPIEREEIEDAVEDLLHRSQIDPSKQEFLALLSRKLALEEEKPPETLEASQEYARLVQRIKTLQARLDVTPKRSSSKYRPDACPNCDLRWDIDIDGLIGFIDLGSFVWKCMECGEIVEHIGPYGRQIARR